MPESNNFKIAVQFMKENPGCTIVRWYNSKGNWCYRLRGSKVNPIMNITESEFKELYTADIIKKENNLWVFNN